MKKNLIFILIFSLFFMVGCSTTTLKNSDGGYSQSISDIDAQLNDPNLQPNSNDTPSEVKAKKNVIKTLKESKKQILNQQQQNAKLEEEKDSLLSYAGIGKFIWALVACVILYFIVTLIKKFIS
jgi:hypothetical protein